MFKVTEAAAAQVKQAANQSGTEGMALRLAAQQKQDGSIEYLMGFDETRENDIRIGAFGVEIVLAPEYAALLDETEMDFVELDEGEEQFVFHNPKDSSYVPPKES